jgi:hypothetical protein
MGMNMTNRIEVTLSNWGTIICFNEQHRKYLIAAKEYSDIKSTNASWFGQWLSPDQEKEYMTAEIVAKAKVEALWDAIPDKTDDLSKSH